MVGQLILMRWCCQMAWLQTMTPRLSNMHRKRLPMVCPITWTWTRIAEHREADNLRHLKRIWPRITARDCRFHTQDPLNLETVWACLLIILITPWLDHWRGLSKDQECLTVLVPWVDLSMEEDHLVSASNFSFVLFIPYSNQIANSLLRENRNVNASLILCKGLGLSSSGTVDGHNNHYEPVMMEQPGVHFDSSYSVLSTMDTQSSGMLQQNFDAHVCFTFHSSLSSFFPLRGACEASQTWASLIYREFHFASYTLNLDERHRIGLVFFDSKRDVDNWKASNLFQAVTCLRSV